jgi:hypothetical protein
LQAVSTSGDDRKPWSEICQPPAIDRAFSVKRDEWIRSLDLKDPDTNNLDRNCILSQIYDLIWKAAAFRIVQEARLVADKDSYGRLKLHGTTHHLLDHCFFHSQMSSIRKLMDPGAMTGKRGVFSLKSLVSDMKKHRDMFTRRNLFAAFGLSMDLAAVREAERAYCRSQRQGVFHIPRELDADSVARLHDDIDRLCGVTSVGRHEGDTVSNGVFDSVEVRLAKTGPICEHVNKYLAHAATPESRATVKPNELAVTLAELWEAHEIICRICQFIDVYLLRQTSHSFLSIYPDNLFLYCDTPLLPQDRVAAVQARHAAYVSEISSWSDGEMDWVLGL